jgi:hypothetical protein
MNRNDIKELDDFVVYKNVALLMFSLKAHILARGLYGTEEYKNDSNGFLNVNPIITFYKSTYFKAPGYDVDMDLHLNVTTEVKHKNGITKKYDDTFTFHLMVTVSNGVKIPKILGLVRGDQLREFSKKESLSKELVPYICKDDYEEIAEEFLLKYCKVALENPIPLPVDEIIKEFGFDVVYGELNTNEKGLFAFRSQYISCYDNCSKKLSFKMVEANTIVINYTLYSRRGVGAVNDTKIHECLHWYLHRKYIELGLALKNGVSALVTTEDQTTDDELGYDETKVVRIVEKQCKNIAPLILMPRGPAIVKFNQLLEKYSSITRSYSSAYEMAISELADFFGVTRISATIRMRALGYSEQPNRINKKYLLSSNGKIRFISRADYDYVLEGDERLAFLDEHQFIKYIDGYVVINLPEFIEWEEDKPRLTKDALKHLSECTLNFILETSFKTHDNIDNVCLYSTETTSKTISVNTEELDRILKMYRNCSNTGIKKKFFKDFRVDEGKSYSEYLITLMQRHNMSIRGLAEKSKVSISVINKYRSYTEAAYTVQVTLSLCAGMQAYPYETFNLLKKMGMDIEGSIASGTATIRNKCYYHMIVNMYEDGVDAWNSYLIENKQPKL